MRGYIKRFLQASVVIGSLSGAYFLGTIHDEVESFVRFLIHRNDEVFVESSEDTNAIRNVDVRGLEARIKSVKGYDFPDYDMDWECKNGDFYAEGTYNGFPIIATVKTHQLNQNSERYKKLTVITIDLCPQEDRLVSK